MPGLKLAFTLAAAAYTFGKYIFSEDDTPPPPPPPPRDSYYPSSSYNSGTTRTQTQQSYRPPPSPPSPPNTYQPPAKNAHSQTTVRTPALSDHSRGIRYPSLPYTGTPSQSQLSSSAHNQTTVRTPALSDQSRGIRYPSLSNTGTPSQSQLSSSAHNQTPALSDHSRGIRYPSLPYTGTPSQSRLSSSAHNQTTVGTPALSDHSHGIRYPSLPNTGTPSKSQLSSSAHNQTTVRTLALSDYSRGGHHPGIPYTGTPSQSQLSSSAHNQGSHIAATGPSNTVRFDLASCSCKICLRSRFISDSTSVIQTTVRTPPLSDHGRGVHHPSVPYTGTPSRSQLSSGAHNQGSHIAATGPSNTVRFDSASCSCKICLRSRLVSDSTSVIQTTVRTPPLSDHGRGVHHPSVPYTGTPSQSQQPSSAHNQNTAKTSASHDYDRHSSVSSPYSRTPGETQLSSTHTQTSRQHSCACGKYVFELPEYEDEDEAEDGYEDEDDYGYRDEYEYGYQDEGDYGYQDEDDYEYEEDDYGYQDEDEDEYRYEGEYEDEDHQDQDQDRDQDQNGDEYEFLQTTSHIHSRVHTGGKPHSQIAPVGGVSSHPLSDEPAGIEDLELAKKLREQARRKGREMSEAYRRAKSAKKKGRLGAAHAHRQDAIAHESKMKELDKRAAKIFFEENNKNRREGGKIDLHGLHVNEALQFAEDQLQTARSRGDEVVHFIVGKGLHSDAGEAKIRPALE